MPSRSSGSSPSSAILAGTAAAAALGYVFGSLAIRRSGIYFAMITLALAQMVYFMFLQMPFTGGEDGLQGVPRGKLLGMIDLRQPLNMYYFVFADLPGGLLGHLPDHPFAVRPGAQGDPGERAAGDLPRL